jgi:hypothetical protein
VKIPGNISLSEVSRIPLARRKGKLVVIVLEPKGFGVV